jgi:two-component system response regulator FixJ
MSGIDLLRQARSMRPALPMIMITGHADVPLAVEAMKAGAADFIEKPFDDERLIGSIHSALEGPVARDEHQKPRDVMERLEALSDREHEVLLSLVRGNPNKVVAYELGISARTVEIHRAHVMAKMNARNLADLVRMALAAGCLDQAGT